MKLRWWLNLVLLLTVASLGTWTYFKSQPSAKIEYPLSKLQSSDINTINVEKIGAPSLTLEKKGVQWSIITPFAARADSIKIQTLMSLLNSRSNQRLVLTDLNRFDLDKPQLKVTLNQQTFSLGTVNTLTMERYVATNDGVFLTTLPFGPEMANQPYSFASKQLLGEDEKPVSFQLPKFSLTLVDGRWSPQPPLKGISQDTLNQWVERWHFAPAQLTESGKTEPSGREIKIKLTSGKIIVFSIKQNDPSVILLRQDENIRYSFPKEEGMKFLQLPVTGFL